MDNDNTKRKTKTLSLTFHLLWVKKMLFFYKIITTVNSQYNSPYTMGKGTQIFTHYSASPSYVEAHHYEDPNQILPLATLKQTTCISYGANTLSGNHTNIPSYTSSNSYSTLNETNSGNNNTGNFHTLIGLNNSHTLHHQQQQQQQNIFPCDFTSIRDISNSLSTNRTTLSRRTDLWQLSQLERAVWSLI